MSSDSILRASSSFVNTKILPLVPRVWFRQVTFGIAALSLQALVSCNANARMTGEARGTAESKMARLLGNPGLPDALSHIVAELGLVRPSSYVNVDHSDFSGLVALVFAVQTRIGRALPIFQQTSYSGKLSARSRCPEAHQTTADSVRSTRRQRIGSYHYLTESTQIYAWLLAETGL
jgi:hypothetical protein